MHWLTALLFSLPFVSIKGAIHVHANWHTFDYTSFSQTFKGIGTDFDFPVGSNTRMVINFTASC